MLLTKSFFNPALLRSDLRRCWPLFAGYTFLWFLILPLRMWNDVPADLQAAHPDVARRVALEIIGNATTAANKTASNPNNAIRRRNWVKNTFMSIPPVDVAPDTGRNPPCVGEKLKSYLFGSVRLDRKPKALSSNMGCAGTWTCCCGLYFTTIIATIVPCLNCASTTCAVNHDIMRTQNLIILPRLFIAILADSCMS